MIYLRQGNDYAANDRIVLTFTDDAGAPVDLTGCDVWFAIKRRRDTADEDAYVLKSTDDAVELAGDPTTGIAYVTLTAAETLAIPVGAWWYAAQAKDASTRIVEVGPSRVTVEQDVITATSV